MAEALAEVEERASALEVEMATERERSEVAVAAAAAWAEEEEQGLFGALEAGSLTPYISRAQQLLFRDEDLTPLPPGQQDRPSPERQPPAAASEAGAAAQLAEEVGGLTPYIARVQHLLSRDDDLRVHTTPASEAVPPTASVAEATAAPISEAISEAISTATSEATSSTRSPRPQPPIAASSFATPKPISAHVRAEIAEIAVANEEAETARSQRLEAALTEAATARAEVEALRAEKHAARMEAEAACTEAEAAEAAASAGCAEAEAALEQVEAAWTETEAAQADAAASRREAEAARMEAAAERVISLVENKPQVVGLVRERFREADTSGNGALDVQEAVQLVGTLCGEVGLAPPRDDKVATLLAMCDKSGDGELQLDEFEKFFAVVLRDAHKKAARTDQAEVGAKLAGMEEMEKMQPEISKAKIDAALVSKAKEVAQVTVLLHQSQSHAKALEAKAKQEKIGLRDALSRALARATEAEAKASTYVSKQVTM